MPRGKGAPGRRTTQSRRSQQPRRMVSILHNAAMDLWDVAAEADAGQILILTYRDRLGHAVTAAAIGCSVRTLAYMLPAAD